MHVSVVFHWRLGQVMGATVRRDRCRAYARSVRAGMFEHMDRDAIEEDGRRDQDRSRVENAGADDLGTDDQEFSSIEDVGALPSENPAVDDV